MREGERRQGESERGGRGRMREERESGEGGRRGRERGEVWN